MAYVCLNSNLHSYLENPQDASYNTSWRYIDAISMKETPYMPVAKDGNIHASKWTDPASVPPSVHVPSEHVSHIEPLRKCPNSCHGLGYCTQPSPGSFVCSCYSDLGLPKDGDCVPVLHRHRCVSYCSNGRGICVLGFCKCNPGFFGVDCSLGLHHESLHHPIPYNTRADSPISHHVPLFYLTDLPAQHTVAYGASRHMEKFIYRSRYRSADASKAAFHWRISGRGGGALHLGSWRWLEANSPEFQASITNNFSNWITSQPFDHGFASGSMPGQGWHDTAAELEAYGKYVHPNSVDRVLMGYMLNERIDGVGAGNKGCFVCFQRDKDIAVPPHPWDMDGAGSTRFAGHVPVKDYTKYSPWRKDLTGEQWPERKYLFFFAGGPMSTPVSGRKQLHQFKDDPRFLLRGAAYGQPGMSTTKGMIQAKFCFTPFGMLGGYTGRHIHAVILGCIPVWWIPNKSERSMLFEDTLRPLWERASVFVHERDISRLPDILESYNDTAIAGMREAMSQLWESLLWSTAGKTLEPIWQESGKHDAAHQLFVTLARKADLRFNTTLERQILDTLPETGINWK